MLVKSIIVNFENGVLLKSNLILAERLLFCSNKWFIVMGTGRAKGKKQSAIAIAARDDTGSGDDDKLPLKRRGRPLKLIQDDINEENVVEKIEEDNEDGEETERSVFSESNKNQADDENGRKRKMSTEIKESVDSVTEENCIAVEANPTVLIKTVSYRKIGSRRKSNYPCRAPDR